MSARPLIRKVVSFLGATALASGVALTAAGGLAGANPNNPPPGTLTALAPNDGLNPAANLNDKCPQGLLTGTSNTVLDITASPAVPSPGDTVTYTVAEAFGTTLDACIVIGQGSDLKDYVPLAAGTWSPIADPTKEFKFTYVWPSVLSAPTVCAIVKSQGNPKGPTGDNNPPGGARKGLGSNCITPPPAPGLTIAKTANASAQFAFHNFGFGEGIQDFPLGVPGTSQAPSAELFDGLTTQHEYIVWEDPPAASWSQATPDCTFPDNVASVDTFGAGTFTSPPDPSALNGIQHGVGVVVTMNSERAGVLCVFDNTKSVIPFTPSYGISISKTGPSLAHVGDVVTYNMAVKSTTNQSLTNVQVTDPSCTSGPTLVSKVGGNQDASLDPGETWTYTCTRTMLSTDANPFVNTATASSDQATATATHSVKIIHPAISVTKTASPTSGTAGTLVTYTYTVTNTGDTALHNVTVTDDKMGFIGTIGNLGVGQSVTLTKTFTLGSSAVTNVVTAQGTDALGKTVSATATAAVSVVSPFVAPSTTTTTTTVPPTTTTTTTPPPATPVKVLPFTGGGHPVRDLFGGAALMVLGGLLLIVGRRRPAADRA